jgi:hypothetical protein
MHISMTNEPKTERIYFRVSERLKKRFEVAALLMDKDSSELFRHIASEFIDRIKAQKPFEFEKLLAEEVGKVQNENATQPPKGRVQKGRAQTKQPSHGRKTGGQ